MMTRWCDSHVDVFVLLLDLGTVGACSALETVLRVCPVGGGRRFWLYPMLRRRAQKCWRRDS
jgi:hypothetical protein